MFHDKLGKMAQRGTALGGEALRSGVLKGILQGKTQPPTIAAAVFFGLRAIEFAQIRLREFDY